MASWRRRDIPGQRRRMISLTCATSRDVFALQSPFLGGIVCNPVLAWSARASSNSLVGRGVVQSCSKLAVLPESLDKLGVTGSSPVSPTIPPTSKHRATPTAASPCESKGARGVVLPGIPLGPNAALNGNPPPTSSQQGKTTASRQLAPSRAEFLPPDLLAVVAAWPALPTAIKAGIVAMVKASKGQA